MPHSLSRFFKSFAPVFRPPFDGLALVVALYYGWCFLVYPHSQILRGNLPDPDDYMYLTQVLDWLQGQGWYDNVQHRLNPPEGVPIHFSRLAMLPMAAIILMFQMLGLGPHGAAMLMALIYPLLLLGGLLVALRWLAQSFMPKRWAGVTSYIAVFATGMMFMFMPGHVDHHGLIVVLVALTLGFVIRMMEHPDNPLYGLAAALVMAVALAIALEVLPWLLVISAAVGLWATDQGRGATRSTLVYGLSLYLGSVLCLAITRPPEQWLATDVLTYSVVYVILTAGIAVALSGVAIAAQAPVLWRWILGALFASMCGFWFLHQFPDLIAGPYGGMDPELAEMMLDEIDEAKPLIHIDSAFVAIFTHLLGALVGMAAGFFFLRRMNKPQRWRWGLIMAMYSVAFLLTVFYQFRFMGILGLMTILPLALLLQRGLYWVGKNLDGRRRLFAEIGLVLLVGPLPAVLLPAMIDGRAFNTGVLLFPVDGSVARTPCDTYRLEHVLNDPRGYGNRQRLIVSSMGQGPELLFRTQHQYLSAPFHMDVTGNIDTTRFFSTPYTAEAEAIARRRQIDLVVACRFVPSIYTRAPGQPEDKGGEIVPDFAPHFVELLLTRKAPNWLKAVYVPGLANYVIDEVHLPPESPRAAPQPAEKP